MAALDWDGARARDKARATRNNRKRDRSGMRGAALEAFVAKHHLLCFTCNTAVGPWAKTGVSARGPWAICTPCVSRQSG